MSYKVYTIPPFDKQLKRLIRKYPSLKDEFINLMENLSKSPIQGASLGKNCFKIRISIHSKGKGKSGGLRLVTYLQILQERVYLLTIFDKSEHQNISDSDINYFLSFIIDQ